MQTRSSTVQASGGTLLLDEIGDLPLELQPKLLRFVQDKEFERVGDSVSRRADVRIISATNVDLDAAVKAGRFREDLLYRLKVVQIDVPPLRERSGDAIALAGGVSGSGRTDKVEILRAGQKLPGSVSGRSYISQTPVRSGDQLYVPERSWISRNPGVILAFLSTITVLIYTVRR
jgi:hypothetical protein